MKRGAFYKTFEHTADLGVDVYAANIEELFSNAALAMFTEMLDQAPPLGDLEFQIEVRGADREELLVRWLNELLFLSQTKGVAFGGFRKLKVDSESISATALAADIEKAGLRAKVEIKAATYHMIAVEETGEGFRGRIIFDL